VAVSGPGRGYVIEPDDGLLLAGDETAIPAIGQLLEAAAAGMEIQVHIEVAHEDARQPLPHHRGATVWWYDLPAGAPPGDALVAAVRALDLPGDGRVWVAGEAAAVQRIRRYLFEDRGFPAATPPCAATGSTAGAAMLLTRRTEGWAWPGRSRPDIATTSGASAGRWWAGRWWAGRRSADRRSARAPQLHRS